MMEYITRELALRSADAGLFELGFYFLCPTLYSIRKNKALRPHVGPVPCGRVAPVPQALLRVAHITCVAYICIINWTCGSKWRSPSRTATGRIAIPHREIIRSARRIIGLSEKTNSTGPRKISPTGGQSRTPVSEPSAYRQTLGKVISSAK